VTVSTGTAPPVEQIRVGLGRPLRLALLVGTDERSRSAGARIALAAGAEVRVVIASDDPHAFVEIAQALREVSPDAVVVCPRKERDPTALAVQLEALRFACQAQRPKPLLLALEAAPIGEGLREALAPFALDTFGDKDALVAALREFRRDGASDLMLRDELVEQGARSVATATGTDALAVDLSERSTSLVLVRAKGGLEAAHAVPLGLGQAADRVVARGGLDRVRRWLPWPVDAPALLERVFNRARWPGALPAAVFALGLEMALAREAIAQALGDAAAAGFDVAAMRAAPSVLVTGRAASFPRPAQTLLVLVDGLEPTGLTSVLREADDGHAQRVGLVASLWPLRPTTVRFAHSGGREKVTVVRGSLVLAPMKGEVRVTAGPSDIRGSGHAGAVGLLIDARGRPLALPRRDAERLPTVARWHAATRALPEERV
jgi:hypothetical protein